MGLLHKQITDVIIGSFYNVYNELGYGFLEKVYENALAIELSNNSLLVNKQFPIKVFYKNKIVGEYYADLLIENKVIVELKAASRLTREHQAQLINYLKATEVEVGLLLNFGVNPEFSRKIFHNSLK